MKIRRNFLLLLGISALASSFFFGTCYPRFNSTVDAFSKRLVTQFEEQVERVPDYEARDKEFLLEQFERDLEVLSSQSKGVWKCKDRLFAATLALGLLSCVIAFSIPTKKDKREPADRGNG